MELDVGIVAVRVADAAVSWGFEDKDHADVSLVHERPGEAHFILSVDGKQFRVAVTEMAK